MNDRLDRLAEIFEAVADRPEAEREGALEELCGGDEALRDEVRRLLEADRRGTASVDHPVASSVLRAADRTGERIGAYRVTAEIGRGGMGVVYRAERADALYEKTVAIKLLAPLADRDVARRFGREREILAGLEHPNVARLLDGGVTDDGIPYLVMEYVEGRPIDRYCDEEGLGARARLALFVELCEGVQFAHRNLVVHRDLKPSNILVTGGGTPVLLDFGIAKLLEGESGDYTQTILPRMTPAYASPEQLTGQPITTASDVYSLGVVFYEILTGRLPHEVRDRPITEVVAAIATEEPPRPSLVARPESAGALRGDLDTILLKALRKEPERRYGSAEALAEDLRRHLEGRPVTARPDTVGYRVSKFVRRHRLGVSAAALLALTIVGGAGGTAWQARVAAGERDRAELEAVKAERINAFLLDMLGAADPRAEGRDVRVADVLDRAAERAEAELAGHPEIAAEVHGTLGRTYLGLGLLEPAEAQARRALERSRAIPGDAREAVAAATRDLGVILSEAGDYETAETAQREAIGRYRELGLAVGRASATNQLAIVMERTGRSDEAERLYREAMGLFEAHPGENDQEYGETLNNLGVALGNGGELAEAEGLHRRALEIMRRLHGEQHPDVAFTMTNLAGALDLQGRYDEAEPLYRDALETRERLLGEDHPATIWGTASYSNLLWLKGDHGRAVEMGRAGVERAERGLPPDHPLTAYARLVHGQALLDLGRPVEAEAELRETLRIRESALPAGHWLIDNTRVLVGAALLGQGRHAEAESEMRPAYERLLAQLGPEHEKTVQARQRLVELYRAWGRPAEADRLAGG